MIKKCAAISAVMLILCTVLTGCVSGGEQQPQQTTPPIKQFSGIEEFKQAVSAAKANASADDTQKLNTLDAYYVLSAPPAGAEIKAIRASTETLGVGYTFGPVADGSYDNRIDLTWIRSAKPADFLTQLSQNLYQSGQKYDTHTANGIQYMIVVPDVNLSTAAPTTTATVTATAAAAATPTSTPLIGKYCQLIYWTEGNASFQCAVPLGFTKDDIAKYCHATQVALN